MDEKKKVSRLDFLRMSAIGASTLFVPATLMEAVAKNKIDSKQNSNEIRLGFIGVGPQGMYLLQSFLPIAGVKVIAVADLYKIKRQRFERRVKKFYADKGEVVDVSMYENYKDLLANKDIDAVVIATHDPWHAIIAIAACKSGKDVYLEKPMTFTIKEGQELIKAVRRNNRIFQLGSHQRSDREFLHAVKMVQEGKIGKISKICAYVGDGPKPYDLPEESIPEGLNWDLWNGPIPKPIHYNHQLNYPITLDPETNEKDYGGWRWYTETGGGYTTDWGAHMFDVAQWAIGKDRSGPVEIIPPGSNGYNSLTFIYDNGIVLSHEQYNGGERGVKFFGDKGWIRVTRGEFESSLPELNPTGDEDYGLKNSHVGTFIDSIRSRIDPNVPVEIGHSSCTVCNLGNIAYRLKRPLKWNPIVEKFVDDPQANKYLHYEYRKGYTL